MESFKCPAKKFGFKKSSFQIKGPKKPLYSTHLSNRWKTRGSGRGCNLFKIPLWLDRNQEGHFGVKVNGLSVGRPLFFFMISQIIAPLMVSRILPKGAEF